MTACLLRMMAMGEMIQHDRSSKYIVADPRMLKMRLLSTRRAGVATRGHVALGQDTEPLNPKLLNRQFKTPYLYNPPNIKH